MSRDRVLVCGSNGKLGQSLLRAIGSERALSASRYDKPPIEGFDHVRLLEGVGIPASTLERCSAVINAAGRISGTAAELHDANVDLPTALARASRNAAVPKFVQVGSFSVYGEAEAIGAATIESPCTEYGRSKALGDRALLQLTAPDFLIEIVRLPFLFSAEQPNLLQPLLSFARRARLMPVCDPEPKRSIITYDDAAAVLVDAAADDVSGLTLAADPQPFTFSLVCRITQEEAGKRLYLLTIPAPAVRLIRVVAPGLARRLFQSSLLEAGANRAGDRPLGLETTMRSIVRLAT